MASLDPPADDNQQVFQDTIHNKLKNVVQQCAVANLFCYGYTGPGKAHSILGYGSEWSLLEQTMTAELLEWMSQSDESLFLTATVCELYQDKAYDILVYLSKRNVPCERLPLVNYEFWGRPRRAP
jgi:hypothetical protein